MFKKILYISCAMSLAGCVHLGGRVEVASEQIQDAFEDAVAPPFSGVVIVEIGERRIIQKMHSHKDIPLVKMDQQMLIGDLSKQITASIALRLAEQGKLKLHSPIVNYLPELFFAPWAKKITPHHLLTHTSGLGESSPLSLVGTPGKSFRYSHAGYELLGKLISRVELKTFPEQVLSISKLCGMKNTVAHEQGQSKFFKQLYPSFIEGWRENANGRFTQSFLERNEAQNPSLGIMSTPEDMVQWNRCLHGGELLSAASYQAMTTPFVTTTDASKEISYGYGLKIRKSFGSLELGHKGHIPGFKSTMIYYPKEKINLVILENISLKVPHPAREFGMHEEIRNIIIEQFLVPPTH